VKLFFKSVQKWWSYCQKTGFKAYPVIRKYWNASQLQLNTTDPRDLDGKRIHVWVVDSVIQKHSRKFLTRAKPEPKMVPQYPVHSLQESSAANQWCQWKVYTLKVCILLVSTYQISRTPNGEPETQKNVGVPEIHFIRRIRHRKICWIQ